MSSTLPTLYNHFTSGGITTGLSVNQSYFTLNHKNISIYSGAMHYFRVPPQYWRDRLRKMRAAGLNTVETYVPWNLHEPMDGLYDFGNGTTDFEQFLDIPKYLQTAQEEDLFVIVRPGPYICAEWEFGGFPSWLLREKDIKVRTSDPTYMKYVTRYFNVLLGILAMFQFTLGGPIVAFQVENEYGSTESSTFRPDKRYLQQLESIFRSNNITELLFTSDSPSQHRDYGTLATLFQTANFARDPRKEFDVLKVLQPGKPTMAMEFWTGWFDHWSETHHLRNNTEFQAVLEQILVYPASVNFYMFHGGTSFGFMNGANIAKSGVYQPDVTSYDYDAPLTENGDYTEKYYIVKKLLAEFSTVFKTPEMPEETARISYGNVQITEYLSYEDVVKQSQSVPSEIVQTMEMLPINNNSGQSYGFTLYRTNVRTKNSTLEISEYHDSVVILLNNQLISKSIPNLSTPGYWLSKNLSTLVPDTQNGTLDILVENWGRNNFGTLDTFNQFKGLQGGVFLDGTLLKNWLIVPLEFKRDWMKTLTNCTHFNGSSTGPGLYKAVLELENGPQDTFLDMSDWNVGIVAVNHFVLGRYFHLGPQQTLYLPGPFLRKGRNEIVVFELYSPKAFVKFTDTPLYITRK